MTVVCPECDKSITIYDEEDLIDCQRCNHVFTPKERKEAIKKGRRLSSSPTHAEDAVRKELGR